MEKVTNGFSIEWSTGLGLTMYDLHQDIVYVKQIKFFLQKYMQLHSSVPNYLSALAVAVVFFRLFKRCKK